MERLTAEKTKLTVKQEKFCLEYARTGNAVKSYINAYNKPKDKYNSAGVESNRLLKNPKIQKRLNELYESHNRKKIMQAEEMKIKLTELARDSEDKKSALKAIELLAKMGGLFINRQELDISSTIPIVIKDDV